MKIPVNASNVHYIHYCKNCNGTDFGFLQKGAQLGIYCSRCGRWLKWADKNEQNLYEMNKPGQNNVANVLNKIRAEIVEMRSKHNVGVMECLDVIDKYKAESEVKEC